MSAQGIEKNLFAATEHLFDSVYQTDVLSEDGCWCIKVCVVPFFSFLYVCVCVFRGSGGGNIWSFCDNGLTVSLYFICFILVLHQQCDVQFLVV